jgi:peptide/nickel transport system permease protein
VGRYIARRLLQAIPMLFILSATLFALVNVAPGDPVAAMSGQRPRPQKRERLRRQLGLDQPLAVQYVVWLIGNDWMKIDADGDGIADGRGERRGILRGDFGFSYKTRKPVLDEIMDRLGNTVYLMTITLIIVFIIAIPIGIISAVKQYSIFDITATTLSFMGQAIPEFWLGMILIIVFYSLLSNPITGGPLLPAGGMKTLGADFSIGDRLKYLILPVTMGAVGWVAWYSRFLRAGMLDVIHQDYIRTARAKGFAEKAVMLRHALKNALIPLVTIFALDIPVIFAGSLYVEIMFSWPGMGRLYYQSATNRDYPLLMAILIIASVFTVLANLLADIAYGFLDPRVRYS